MLDNTWLMELAVRGGLILLLASLAASLLRSAVWRHLVWASALVGLLALPLLMGGLPAIPLPVLPAVETAPPEAAALGTLSERLPKQERAAATAVAQDAMPAAVESARRALPARPPETSRNLLGSISPVALWAGIALLLGAWMALDGRRRRTLLARARPLESPDWRRELAAHGTRAALYTSNEIDVPVTWGLLRPVLLLPAGAEHWSASLRRHVLLHELAHVERGDASVLGLARLACALHWFNPLAWWALSRLVREAELAADDRVLGAGVKPSSYAGDLIDFARRRLSRPLPRAAAAMARKRSALGTRIAAILDDRRERSSPSPARLALALLFAGLVVLPLAAAMRPDYRTSPLAAVSEADEPAVRTQPAAAPEPAVAAEPRSEATPVASATVASSARESARAIAGTTTSARESTRSAASVSSSGEASSARSVHAAPGSSMADCGESRGTSSQMEDDHLEVTVRSRHCKLEIEAEGEIEYAADDSGVVHMARGARLEIDERRRGRRRELIVTPGAGGAPEHRYFVEREERPFDGEARAWLAQVLPEIFRSTGLNAKARVARILAERGAGGVLDEIRLIRGDYVGRIYFNHLLDQGDLDRGELVAWIELAGEELGSDFELAETLMRLPAGRLAEPGVGEAFVEAATTIGSDFELRRTLVRLLDHSRPSQETLDRILDAAGSIGSDFEAAELLIRVADVYPRGAKLPASYYEVADSIGSDFELRRTLARALERPLDGDVLRELLRTARSIGSDFELAELLVQVSRTQRLDAAARDAYQAALDTVGSDFEHRRAAEALARTRG